MNNASHCPATVAIAAPVAPRFAPNGRMSIGSRIMFVIAPTSCVIIGIIILPIDCKILLSIISTMIPIEQQVHIVKYEPPYSATKSQSAISVCAAAEEVYVCMNA